MSWRVIFHGTAYAKWFRFAASIHFHSETSLTHHGAHEERKSRFHAKWQCSQHASFLVDWSPWKYCRFRTNTGRDHKFHGRCSQAKCFASKDVLSNFTVFSPMLHACNSDPQNLSVSFIVLDVLAQSSHPSHQQLHPTSPSRGLRQALRVEQWERWVR